MLIEPSYQVQVRRALIDAEWERDWPDVFSLIPRAAEIAGLPVGEVAYWLLVGKIPIATPLPQHWQRGTRPGQDGIWVAKRMRRTNVLERERPKLRPPSGKLLTPRCPSSQAPPEVPCLASA